MGVFWYLEGGNPVANLKAEAAGRPKGGTRRRVGQPHGAADEAVATPKVNGDPARLVLGVLALAVLVTPQRASPRREPSPGAADGALYPPAG